VASPQHPEAVARPVTDHDLLASDDPSPVAILNPAAPSPFLLTGDHAGVAVPKSLDRMGLADAELARHIAWDIGVADIGRRLAHRLDAVFVHQIYSRLVIDCNRAPASPEAIPPVSDGTTIPRNIGLAPGEIAARVAAVHAPYHAAIAAEIARRDALGQPTVLVALHSFTPAMAGFERPWDIGVLHDGGDAAFALRVLAALVAQPGFVTGDNQPYRMDATDYSVPCHAYPRRLPYVEVEFRQDHLATPGGVALWAERFGAALKAALSSQGRRSIEGSAGSAARP
jgi:predicted N-formylglutamate amidohydrolase